MQLLDIPAFLLAALAAWLGMSLLLRDPRDRVTRAFAWLSLHLVLYGLATSLAPATASPRVAYLLLTVQAIESALLPPAFLHFIIRLISGRFPPRDLWALAFFYASGAGLALYALLGPGMIAEQTIMRFPPGLMTWWWVLQRGLPLILALALMYHRFRGAGGDDLARRRRAMFAISAWVGVAGALIATVSSELRFSPAFGHALMALALLVLAYGVLVYRTLLPERMAKRAVYRSMIGGFLTAVYVACVVAIEPLARNLLQINGQFITAITLIVLISIAGPLRDWVSSLLDRAFFHRELDFGHLLREVGADLMERGTLGEQLQTALSSICGRLDLVAGLVAVREGAGLRSAAIYGVVRPDEAALRAAETPEGALVRFNDWPAWTQARLLLPLRNGADDLGVLVLGPKRSGEPYRNTERAVLSSLAAYLALAIRHARRQQEEQVALAALAEQSRQLQVEQELLLVRAAEATRAHEPATVPLEPAQVAGLKVFALGPLRVERDGQPIERWGGDKAGTYQAEALFAFLLDRRGRGLTKDEAAEVIWPDLDLEKADMAFHRTVSALRRTLEPGLRRGNESSMVTYHHERYWLNPAAVGWCDVEAFGAAVERGHTLLRRDDLEAARLSFAQAGSLYRGEYLDDCPFFGDSAYVEPRREELRCQHRDALLALGAAHERLGQAGEAATCYRRALAASDGDCPRADEGLARLQIAV
jgi:DNA-binding SARP family transcriptional activator/GAF domain-containing protein